MTSFDSTAKATRFQSNPARWFLLLVTAQLLAMAFIAPYLLSRGSVVQSGAIYYLGSFVSTRITGRTYFAFNYPLAFDARALGFLSGALISLLVYSRLSTLFSKPRVGRFGWIALRIVPSIVASGFIIDTFTGYSVRHVSINGMFVTGLLFGLIIPFYLVPAVRWSAALPQTLVRFFATARPASS